MTEMSDEAKEARTAALDAKAAAAAEATLDPKAKLPEGHVRVRITKAGHNKVHTGGPPQRQEREDGNGAFVASEDLFPKYKMNDVPILPLRTAKALEERFYAEIQD